MAQGDVVGVGGAGGADPLSCACLVEAEAFGEDRGGQSGGEREQRGMSAWAARDPVALRRSRSRSAAM
jgi:hypothetical protein